MNNYKIKVNNEAESKEAQELFFELGYYWNNGLEVKNLDAKFLYAKNNQITMSYYSDNFSDSNYCELTLPQLSDFVAQSKNKQCLISGADALRALADGELVEVKRIHDSEWQPAQIFGVSVFTDSETTSFRIKPRTMKIELEIPACGKNYKRGQLIWILNSLEPNEYCSVILDESDELPAYWWETEEEIKQVVAALRGGIKA